MTGEFLGSLQWASPEQVDGSHDQVDVRSDVYGLGVLLYQTLTGEFPYRVQGPMRDVLGRIVDRKPLRPGALRSELDKDIDTIVLKCLSKDADRRYQSAGALARDIELHLNHRPITARQDSAWYVMSRTMLRHWVATATVLIGLFSLVVFLSTSVILYRRAAIANADALVQANRAAQIHQDWQANISVVVREIANGLTRLPKSMALRNRLLKTSLSAFGQLKQHGGESPEMLADWATALVALSDMAVALDDRDEAMRLRRKALAIREGLVHAEPERAEWNRDLALSYVLVGDLMEGPQQIAERRALYEKTLAIDEGLIARQPDNAEYINNLAFDYERLGNLARLRGDYPQAERYFEKQHVLAQSLVERFPDKPSSLWAQLSSLGQLAAMSEQKGDTIAAARLHLDARSVTESLVELEPENPEFVKALVSTAVSVAADQMDARSLAQLVRVEPRLRHIVEMEPENHDRQRDQAHYYMALSGAYLAVKEVENAERYASRALEVLHSLPVSAHDNPDQLRIVLTVSNQLAIFANGRGDAEARSVLGMGAVTAANRLEEKLGTDSTTLTCLAGLWTGCEIPEFCDPARGESLARRSIELSNDRLPRPWLTLAQSLHVLKRDDEACKAVKRALELFPSSQQGLRVRAMELVEEMECGGEGVVVDEQTRGG